MKNSNDAIKVVGALVIGAAAGATLGILFAPKKGSKTRKNIVGSAKKLTRNFKEKMDDKIKDLKKQATKESKLLKKGAIKAEKQVEKQVDKKVESFKSIIDNQKDHKPETVKV